MNKRDNDLIKLKEILDAQMPGGEWRSVLNVFIPTSVADSLQVQMITGLDKQRLKRVWDKINAASAELPPFVSIIDLTLDRPGKRGRMPTVYALSESGAAMLRLLGFPDKHACRLSNEKAITHALAMLDVHTAAVRAGLEVATDRTICYSDGQSIRPDHVVVLPDKRQMILEVEQSISDDLLPRITESINHKILFFHSPESANFIPEVRIIFNLPRGTMFEKSATLWRKVMTLRHSDGQIPKFRLLAITLSDFLAYPDWNLESDVWRDLTYSEPKIEEEAKKYWLPQPPERNPADDADLIMGLWAEYINQHRNDPLPRLDFMIPIEKIYLVSQSQRQNPTRLAPPTAAVYLMSRYLELHPQLVERVRSELHRGHGKIRWTHPMVLHRMQLVINAVLEYYGIGNGDGIRVEPRSTTAWNEVPSQFYVKVELDVESPVRYGEAALAWFMWALFEFAEPLNLGALEYW